MKNSLNSDDIYLKLNERIQALKTEIEQFENSSEIPHDAKSLESLENVLSQKGRELVDLLIAKKLQQAVCEKEDDSKKLAKGFKKN